MKSKILLPGVFVIAIVAIAWSFPVNNLQEKISRASRPAGPIFSSVHAHRQAKGVTVAWSSEATAATVICFDVIRTYEDPNDPYSQWDRVGSATCNSARSYKSTEENVSAGFISYRVVASMVGGGTAMSEVETLHIVQH